VAVKQKKRGYCCLNDGFHEMRFLVVKKLHHSAWNNQPIGFVFFIENVVSLTISPVLSTIILELEVSS